MNEVIRNFLENYILITVLIPAIIAITLAFVYKNVFISLGFGLYFGIVVDTFLKGTGLLKSFVKGIFDFPIFLTNSLGSPGNAGIVMQILLISGFIYLLTYTGGLKAFANSIVKFTKTRTSAQFMTWVMGLLVFFDDYANALIVGPVMKNITDKAKVSREKLAFIIDATAAPIAGLVLISTWIGYEISLIKEQLINLDITAAPMGLFIQSIPFRFYNILMLIFIVMTIYMKREYGPMYHAEKRALNGGNTNHELDDPKVQKIEENEIDDVEVNKEYKASFYEGLIPLLVLIFSSFYFFYYSGAQAVPDLLVSVNSISDMFYNIGVTFSNADTTVVLSQAALLAILVTFIISGLRGAFKISDGIDITLRGAAKLLPTAFVLILAWSLGTIMDADHLNTGNQIANILGEGLPYQIIPLIIFLISSFMAFATGTSYGTMGILFPLAIPLAYATNQDLNFLVLTISAILTGTILGDHCSPISDTTLLSSAGADVNHLDHVKTQMPYAITVGIITSIGYLLSAFIINVQNNMYLYLLGIYLLLIFMMYLVLKIIGKKVI